VNRITVSVATAAVALAVSGCTVFQGFFEPVMPESQQILSSRSPLPPVSRNYFVLEDPQQSVVGEPQIVFTRKEDTFSDLAREYGLGYDEIVAANPGIDPWLPGDKTAVLLPTQYVLPDVPRHGLVLNIASKRLFYFPPVAAGEPVTVQTYPIGIGRIGWETPLGKTSVIAKARNPSWYVPVSVRKEHAETADPLPAVVTPGQDNTLGNRALKLGIPGYLIHGTNQPYGVGMRVSHGCVRLYPENIESLYTMVEIGETVRIIDEPYLVGRDGSTVYFEGHQPLEDDSVSPEEHLQQLFSTVKELDDIAAQDAVRAIAADVKGVPIRFLAGDTLEVFARARLVVNTVERDPDAPTLAEVRALLDGPSAPGGQFDGVVADEPVTADE